METAIAMIDKNRNRILNMVMMTGTDLENHEINPIETTDIPLVKKIQEDMTGETKKKKEEVPEIEETTEMMAEKKKKM